MENKTFDLDVITIGGAAWDVFIRTDDSRIISIRERDYDMEYLAFEYGKKVYLDDMLYLPGGGGNNTAVAFARLGLQAAFVGCVGQDEEGRHIMMNLKSEGVRTDYMQRVTGKKTGMSVIINSFEGDRTVFSFRGSNDAICITPQLATDLNRAKWFYLPSINNETHKSMACMFESAKQNNIRIACNPGPSQLKLGLGGLHPLLEITDIIIMNNREAERLTGRQAKHRFVDNVAAADTLRGEPWISDVRDLMKMIAEHGPKTVVITEGLKGSQVYDGKQFYWMPPYPSNTVDTLGAGDAFAATFVAAQIMNKNVVDALKMANANASRVVQEFGAQTGLGKLAQVQEVIDRFPRVQPLIQDAELKFR